jgi:hypothetical protein
MKYVEQYEHAHNKLSTSTWSMPMGEHADATQ